MKPRDLLRIDAKFWRITGIFLGAAGQESVVGLEVIGILHSEAYGKDIPEMFVPVAIIEAGIRNGAILHYTLLPILD